MSHTLKSDHSEVGLDLGTLIPGQFLARQNRFRTSVRVGEHRASAHLANPGRLTELLVPGCSVWLRPALGLARKTDYDLVLVSFGDVLVSVDSRLPNALVGRALNEAVLPWVKPATALQAEATLGESRLDFCLFHSDGSRTWIEAKSVTLVNEDVARFPDAPTRRGRRHIRELRGAIGHGDAALVIFIVQRQDANCFAPNAATDPEFADALRKAAAADVQVRAIRCCVTTTSVSLDQEIPVFLDGQLRPGYNPSDSRDHRESSQEGPDT